MNVGLIGYGRFGRLAARYLARDAKVLVCDRVRLSGALPAHVRRASLAAVAAQPVVILAVPISAMRATLRSIAPHLTTGALVVDVCTVKVEPIRWMKKILPTDVRILGTHPLFGPDSDTGELRGQRVVLTPVRLPRAQFDRIASVLRRRGMVVSTMSARRHDRMIAETILLTHYVGRYVGGAGFRRRGSGTDSYRRLLSVIDVAMNDSLQLLQDVWRFNPYSKDVASALRRSSIHLSRLLRAR
jgi:prephenate dehydrogenase